MVIDLVEWQPYALSPTEATDALLDALGARKEAVLVFRRGAGLAGVWTLTVPNVVGQIRVGRDCLLRMAPKVAVSNIFAMLELAYQLESFRFETGVVSVESIADIYDRLANILALRVISREDFIAMKCFAGRPQDIADARLALGMRDEPIELDLLRRITRRYGRAASDVLEQLLGP